MIHIDNLWKSYPARRESLGFKEFVLNLHKILKNRNDVFWALKGISFDIKKGDCVGIIGKNGAGKSTLLSILLGVANATKGIVDIKGRRTPLLELGAGFHPDLSGRENIIINGILLGNTKKEIMKKSAEIIAFSEIAEFIDMPVRTYSNGMYMRLAFSVAVHTEPEILLIDEILSVGDEFFQVKSGEAIKKLINNGVTTVFVSHSMDAIKSICSRVIWLEHGMIKADGDPADVVGQYLEKGR
jgi:ABC-type polysaccharide/polyol phosphate transport system ATPase subunit